MKKTELVERRKSEAIEKLRSIEKLLKQIREEQTTFNRLVTSYGNLTDVDYPKLELDIDDAQEELDSWHEEFE